MGLRFGCARALSAVSTWGLKNVFRRPAANFPGKVALYADPRLISDLSPRLRDGSVMVVGTNGKTTVTNMLATALGNAGRSVICNWTGANLDSGIATALLQNSEADWGVFECDELWLVKVLPQLKSDYLVLTNLFRDQLDRVGEINIIQDSIVKALEGSPTTVLIYNADDPHCQSIANRVANGKIAFGLDEDMHLVQNTVADAHICQSCLSIMDYEYHQYDQLGKYRCPNCGFARASLSYAATDIKLAEDGLSFTVSTGKFSERVSAPFPGAYMVYNLLALCAVGTLVGLPFTTIQATIDAYDPKNGRLEPYTVKGRPTLLNLAKNPAGFNQNLRIVAQGSGRKAVGFFVNDKEGDGRDVSWLWDIDFQELSGDSDLVVYAGGIRRNDVQVRLKYAGISSQLVDGAEDMLARVEKDSPDAKAYLIANYTALPSVKAELDRLCDAASPEQTANSPMNFMEGAEAKHAQAAADAVASGLPEEAEEPTDVAPFTIVHVLPDLLNLYGDGGNVTVLERRLTWRGIPVRIERVEFGMQLDLSQADIVFLGGGPDREQELASKDLEGMADTLRAYVEDDGVLLAICGGYQIVGNEWLLGDETKPGLGIIDFTTKRAPGGSRNRLVDNIVIDSPLASMSVVGYENHAGRTYLGAGVKPFGRVLGSHGKGNNDKDMADGALYRNAVCTYLHGPLLSKNPQVADELIRRALARRARKAGTEPEELVPLDDSVEHAANDYMRTRLGVR